VASRLQILNCGILQYMQRYQLRQYFSSKKHLTIVLQLQRMIQWVVSKIGLWYVMCSVMKMFIQQEEGGGQRG